MRLLGTAIMVMVVAFATNQSNAFDVESSGTNIDGSATYLLSAYR